MADTPSTPPSTTGDDTSSPLAPRAGSTQPQADVAQDGAVAPSFAPNDGALDSASGVGHGTAHSREHTGDHAGAPRDASARLAEAMARKREQADDTDVAPIVLPDPYAPTDAEPVDGTPAPPGTGLETRTAATNTPSAPVSGTAMPEASVYLRAVHSNLDDFAVELENGEFADNGAGQAGRIWRSMAAVPDEAARLDIWGELLATATKLWENGKTDTAIALIAQSRDAFGVPPTYAERVEDALRTARDFVATTAAEAAFTEGMDTQALVHADAITDADRAAHYRADLQRRIEQRRKQRKAVFGVAAAAVVALIVASGVAIATMERIQLAPPTPDFSNIGDPLEQISTELRDSRAARDALQGIGATTGPEGVASTGTVGGAGEGEGGTSNTGMAPISPDAPPTGTPSLATPAPALPDTDGAGTGAPNSVEPSELGVAPTPPTQPTEPNLDAQPTQPSVQTPEGTTPPDQAPLPSGEPQGTGSTNPAVDATPAPQASANTGGTAATGAPATDDLRGNCILGYTGLAEAQALVEEGKDRLDASQMALANQRISDFNVTLERACSGLDITPAEVARGARDLDAAIIQQAAESVLRGPNTP